MPERVSDLIKNKVEGGNLSSSQFFIARAAAIFSDEIKNKLPSHYQQITPQSFRGGVLKVVVPSPSAANEIRFFEKDLIKSINRKLGRKFIRKISYRF